MALVDIRSEMDSEDVRKDSSGPQKESSGLLEESSDGRFVKVIPT